MIHHTLGNNKDRTAQTLREQHNETPFSRKFRELRSRYPQEDIMILMDAASQAIAEAQTIEQQLAEAIERTAETIAYSDAVLDEMYAECRERDDIGRSESLTPWLW